MRIWRFQPSQAEALASLFHASVHLIGRRHYTPDQLDAWSPAPPDPARYLIRAGERTMLVAVDDGRVPLGYGDVDANGHIDHLYCRFDRIGTGVGSALHAALEAVARATGVPTLSVEASEGARRFFRRQGFTEEGRHDFTLRGVAIHNYRMFKRLT